MSSLLAIKQDSFFSFLSLLFLFLLFSYVCVCVCVCIPLGSRQNSFSADTFFFLSLFCFLHVWIYKENSYQTLPQKKKPKNNKPQPNPQKLNLNEIQIFATLKERKKEWMNERMNEPGFGNITCICTTMHCYLIRLLVLCFNCFIFFR